MSAPWSSKTGLAKAAAVLATIFGISLGLCGATSLALSALSVTGRSFFATALWMIETAGLVLSALGLLVVGIIAVGKGILQRISSLKDKH